MAQRGKDTLLIFYVYFTEILWKEFIHLPLARSEIYNLSSVFQRETQTQIQKILNELQCEVIHGISLRKPFFRSMSFCLMPFGVVGYCHSPLFYFPPSPGSEWSLRPLCQNDSSANSITSRTTHTQSRSTTYTGEEGWVSLSTHLQSWSHTGGAVIPFQDWLPNASSESCNHVKRHCGHLRSWRGGVSTTFW